MLRALKYLAGVVGVAFAGVIVLNHTLRAAGESAEYEVIESDGAIEIREYPDLMLAATASKVDSQGRDGSFMRLFQYISGANEAQQKIAMTTPVFMEGETGDSDVTMGFVMPKEVAAKGLPKPKGDGVELRERKGGQFATIRFPGRVDSKLAKEQEAKLRGRMKSRNLEGEGSAEVAGYDPPFTPAASRRNEVLIRLSKLAQTSVTDDADAH